MQKHRKVAYAGAESPRKRLCYAKQKAEKKKDTALTGCKGKREREQPQSNIFHEHNRLFEAYLTPKTEHNWMQKHRKVAYAGAESPLKRLCYSYAKKKAEKINKRILP